MSALRFSRALLLLAPAALLTLAFSGCDPELPEAAPAPAAGSADFSAYVAVGDDYTAGTTNGGLTPNGQQSAFPELLARQFALVSPGRLITPLLPAGTATPNLAVEELTPRGLPLLIWVPVPGAVVDSIPGTSACDPTRFQFTRWDGAAAGLPGNLGVPGLKLSQLATPGLGNEVNQASATADSYNPYFERLLPAGDNRSYFDVLSATRRSRTFFTVLLGLSDFLPYVRSGGTCGTLPAVGALTTRIATLLDTLTANGSKGAVITLPTLKDLPLTRTRVAAVPALLGLTAGTPLFVESTTPGARPTVLDGTTIVLSSLLGRIGRLELANGQPADSAFGLTRHNPLRRRDVLLDADAQRVNNLIGVINDVIFNQSRSGAKAAQLAYVNGGELFQNLGRTGLLVDGVRYGPDPITGNFYTIDGYSLSPRGNALVANTVLSAINTKFGGHLPLLDPNEFPTTPRP